MQILLVTFVLKVSSNKGIGLGCNRYCMSEHPFAVYYYARHN